MHRQGDTGRTRKAGMLPGAAIAALALCGAAVVRARAMPAGALAGTIGSATFTVYGDQATIPSYLAADRVQAALDLLPAPKSGAAVPVPSRLAPDFGVPFSPIHDGNGIEACKDQARCRRGRSLSVAIDADGNGAHDLAVGIDFSFDSPIPAVAPAP